MRHFPRSRSLVAAMALAAALGGCTSVSTTHLDPLAVNGRDGGGGPLTAEALMRIGAAARAGGDYANAVGIFRRAAQMAPGEAAPLAAAGDALLDMGANNEAIVSYNAALARDPHNLDALRGLAKAYLKSSRPELAFHPLSVAQMAHPNDPDILLLLGVADDMTGQHTAAQASYRHGLQLAPGRRGLAVDLALSLTLTGNYPAAIAVLRPLAMQPHALPVERQTLALIYGLEGNMAEAQRLGRMDLDEASVEHNLAYYDTLRALSPQARERAIQPHATAHHAAIATSLP
jgi:Flp pilus assembly protein TadD